MEPCRIRQIAMPKLDYYYPQHFRRTRPYQKDFITEATVERERGFARRNSGSELAMKAITAAWSRLAAPAPRLSAVKVIPELQGALVFGEWVLGGSVLYEFEPALVEALVHSDPGEVRLEDLNHPFDAVYFAFGEGHDIAFANGAKVTGAYVLNTPGVSLRVVLTAPLPEVESWCNRADEIYDILIPSEYQSLPLAEAIDLSIKKDIDGFIEQAHRSTKPRPPEEMADIRAAVERLQSNQTAYAQAVRLIVNGLLYVTAYQQDVRERWQADTPAKWVEKVSKGSPKEIARNLSKLNAMGYSKVHRVGEYFSAQSAVTERAAHWRRGHWRNQAFGPAMALRRIRWIRPVAVLGGRIPDEEPRVYEVPMALA